MSYNKQGHIFLSIVIPIYNTPKEYIRRCINSVINQACESWEIIIIDDGSTTLNKSDFIELAKEHDNIKIFHTTNNGVSAARNKGITLAEGKYLAFVDADDVVKAGFIQEAKYYAEEYDADIVIGTIEYVPGTPINQGTALPTCFEGEDIQFVKKALIGIDQSRIPYKVLGTPCGRIFKRELAEKVNFPVDITIREDQIYNREILNLASRVLLVPNLWYSYYQNDFSAMHNRGGRKGEKMFSQDRLFWRHWNEISKNEKNLDTQKELLIHSIHGYCTAIRLWIVPKKMNYIQKRNLMEEIYDDYVLEEFIPKFTYRNFKYKIMKICVKYRLYFALYSIQFIKSKFETEEFE